MSKLALVTIDQAHDEFRRYEVSYDLKRTETHVGKLSDLTKGGRALVDAVKELLAAVTPYGGPAGQPPPAPGTPLIARVA